MGIVPWEQARRDKNSQGRHQSYLSLKQGVWMRRRKWVLGIRANFLWGGGCTCQVTWLDISGDLLLDSDPEYWREIAKAYPALKLLCLDAYRCKHQWYCQVKCLKSNDVGVRVQGMEVQMLSPWYWQERRKVYMEESTSSESITVC